MGKKFDPVSRHNVEEIRGRGLSVWDISSESQSHLKRVQEHIIYLLDILEPHSTQIQPYLEQAEKYTISFCIHWEPHGEHGSYQIPGSLLSRIVKLCHFVEFSFIATAESR